MTHIIAVKNKTLTETGISVKDAMRLADRHCQVCYGFRVDWDLDLQEAKEIGCNSGTVHLEDQDLYVEIYPLED